MGNEQELLEKVIAEQKETNRLLRIIVSNSEQALHIPNQLIKKLFLGNESNSQIEMSVVDESR